MNQAPLNPNDPFVVQSRLEQTERWVKAGFDIADFRFNALEAKIDKGIADLNEKFDYVIGVLDAYLKKAEDNDTNNLARDAQLDRHDRWHHQVASRLHLKLK